MKSIRKELIKEQERDVYLVKATILDVDRTPKSDGTKRYKLYLKGDEFYGIPFYGSGETPLDKEDELPVIEVDINGSKRLFLMGRTGNLYEDDDRDNRLVGKIIYNTVGKSTIYWCKDYKL